MLICDSDSIFNLEIQVLSVNIGRLKDKLIENTEKDLTFRVVFTMKNISNKALERTLYSERINYNHSQPLCNYDDQEDLISFEKIGIDNLLETSIAFNSSEIGTRISKPSCKRLKDFVLNKLTILDWKVSFDCVVKIKYFLTNKSKVFKRAVTFHSNKELFKKLSNSSEKTFQSYDKFKTQSSKILRNYPSGIFSKLISERIINESKNNNNLIIIDRPIEYQETVENNKRNSGLYTITNMNINFDTKEENNKGDKKTKNDNLIMIESSYAEQNAINLNFTVEKPKKQAENKIVISEPNKVQFSIDSAVNSLTFPVSASKENLHNVNKHKRTNQHESFGSNSSSNFSDRNNIPIQNIEIIHNMNKFDESPSKKINDSLVKIIQEKNSIFTYSPTKEVNSIDLKDIVESDSPIKRSHTFNDLQQDKMHNEILFYDEFSAAEVLAPQIIQVESGYDKKLGENMCEAFFISGIPYKDAKIIPDSTKYMAPCQHEDCSMFYAYRPEILHRLPTKNFKNFELNNCEASLCFPSGIKVCFETNEKKIKPMNNFMTIITNADGERFYMMNYHFYKKIDSFNYQKIYKDTNPLRYFYSKLLPEIEDEKTPKVMMKKLHKMMEVCNNFSENDYLYVPYCFSFISSNPNGPALEKAIESIIKILSSFNNENCREILESLLTHLLYEVPSPPINCNLAIELPFIPEQVFVQSSVHNNLVTVNYDLIFILNFSFENIFLIHYLMLMEQKILFIAPNKEYNVLSQVTEAFLALLYPIRWVNSYIPVLAEDLVKYLQSFMPFIMGIDESLMKVAETYLDTEIIYTFDLKKDVIMINGKKKVDLKSLSKELPPMPEDVFNYFKSELKILKKKWDKLKKEKTPNKEKLMELELTLREVFARSMVKLFGDFSNFTSIIDGVALFNTASLVANRNSNGKFYSDLTQSQNFRQFIQFASSNEESYYYNYFEEMCNKYQNIQLNTPTKLKNSNNIITLTPMKSNPPSHNSLVRSQTEAEFCSNSNSINNSENNHPIKKVKTYSDLLHVQNQIANNKETKSQTLPKSTKNSSKNVNQFSHFARSSPEIAHKHKITSNSNHASIYSLAPFFLRETLPKDKVELYKKSIEKRIFDESLDFSVFSEILQSPPKEIKTYPQIEEHLKQFDHFNMPFHFFKMQEKSEGQENQSSENDFQDAYPNSYKILQQLEDIKKKRKRILSIQEKDEKVDKFIKQQVKRKQSLISIILSSDTKQLEIYQEQIGNIIKDEMGKILTSTPLGKENLRDLSFIFKYRYARSQLAKILFQEKFKENQKLCLEEKSFQEMYEIITNALICCQSDIQLEDIRLITKSTFYYYKIVQKHHSSIHYYIYQEIAKKSPYNFWKQADFWKFYLDAEIDENTSTLSENIRDVEDYYFEMLLLVSRVMIDLGLEVTLVSSLISDSMAKNYIKKENLLNEMKKTLDKIFKNNKMLK